MEDQGQSEVVKKKKVKWVRGIFKWLFIGLLVLLLIGAIFFQVSWKITTLLLILLLASTVLSKNLRKWFWLGAGGVIAVLIIWVFLPVDNEGWRPYTFDEEIAAFNSKYAVPDEENAALIYDSLIEKFDSNSYPDSEPNDCSTTFDYLSRNAWSDKDYPLYAAWLEEQQPALTMLMQATKMPACYFAAEAEFFLSDIQMERLREANRWVEFLAFAANHDIANKQNDKAIEKYIAILKIGSHFRQQPDSLFKLVGMGIQFQGRDNLNKFIIEQNPTEEHLKSIGRILQETMVDWSSAITAILEREEIQTKSLLGLFYQINARGKVRLSLDPTAAVRAAFSEEMPPLIYWQKRFIRAGVIFAWFVVPSTPEKSANIVDKQYERYYAMADPEYDWQKEPKEFPMASPCSTSVTLNYNYMIRLMVDMLEGAYYRRHDIYVRTITEQKGSRIIIALRRYKNENGDWPKNLEDMSLVPAENLVDPVNNGSFTYNLVDDGFELYSKGKNGVDEGGERKTTFDPNTYEYTTSDDRLIWPSKRSRAEEEETEVE